MVMPSSGDADAATAEKIWKLETRDSLVKLQDDLLTPGAARRLREEQHGHEPLVIRMAVKRGRLSRPLELFTVLVVHVAVVRLLANDVLDTEKRWRVRGVVVVVSAGATYLLANGLSAVNVQTREQPVRLVITTNDLAVETPDLTTTSTVDKSFAESRPGNPVTNTILRNLLLPEPIETQQTCSDMNVMTGAAVPNPPKGAAAAPLTDGTGPQEHAVRGEFPMNASLAAELLLYSVKDPSKGSAWGKGDDLLNPKLATQLYLELNSSKEITPSVGEFLDVPTTRLTRLLPPTLTTTEREERELYKNASLRSWNMTFSNVHIEPGTLWVDAVTIEREMATPRLASKATSNSGTRYFAIDPTNSERTASKFILKAGDAADEGIELVSVCVDRKGVERLASPIDVDFINKALCVNRSASPLMVVSRGKRLAADAVIENATIESSELVFGKGSGVIVNMREIFSVTVARMSWRLQNLSTIYNAKCADIGGCMGLDVALPSSGQRLLVSASALPLAAAPSMFVRGNLYYDPLPLVSVRRPEAFISQPDLGFGDPATAIGNVLMLHSVRNATWRQLGYQKQASYYCLSKPEKRLARYMNNHIYMESTLQPAYTAAAFFLLQGGVTRDILNQSWTTRRMLAFDGNKQDVKVVVFTPRLNVILTLAGCVVLVAVVALVLLWPLFEKQSDPLAHITTPHTIANVLVNETAFPPLLLTRSVVPSGDKVCEDNADDFIAHSLSLKRKEAEDDSEDDKRSEQ